MSLLDVIKNKIQSVGRKRIEQEKAKKALDAVLTNAVFSPKIVQEHHDFWFSLGFDTRKEAYDSKEYHANYFYELQKAAAIQRLRLGFKEISEEKLLFDVLSAYNAKELDKHLQQKNNLDLLPLSVFSANPVVMSQEVFIQEVCSFLLLRETGINLEDMNLLQELKQACSLGEKVRAIKKLMPDCDERLVKLIAAKGAHDKRFISLLDTNLARFKQQRGVTLDVIFDQLNKLSFDELNDLFDSISLKEMRDHLIMLSMMTPKEYLDDDDNLKIKSHIASLLNQYEDKLNTSAMPPAIDVPRSISPSSIAESYVYQGRTLQVEPLTEQQLNERRVQKKAMTSALRPAKPLQIGFAEELVKKTTLMPYTLYSFQESINETVHADGFFAHVIDCNQENKGHPAVTVELIQPPLCVADSQVRRAPPQTQLSFYLDMALALLVANGATAPSKEHPIYISGGSDEEREWIWTALVLLGEEKFNFSPEALVVQDGGFKPDQVFSPGFFAPNIKDKSIYHFARNNVQLKKVLGDKLKDVDKVIEQTNDITVERSKLIQSQLKKSMQHTKEQLSDTDGARMQGVLSEQETISNRRF